MRTMQFGKRIAQRRQSGQAMIETILVLTFILLPLLLNALNLGYFFIALVNLQSSTRTGAEYSIVGSASPTSALIPPATSSATCAACTVSHIVTVDLTDAPGGSANTAVQVCSDSNGLNNPGKATQSAKCTTAGTIPGTYSFPSPDLEPETNGAGIPAFVLNRVDVAYKFTPLIPGAIFNAGLLGFPRCGGAGTRSCCNADGTCVLHRYSQMRELGP